jgi:hypothetical protein
MILGGVHAAGLLAIVLVCVTPVAASSSERVADQKDAPSEELVWRSHRTCGANCVYFLLRAHGIHADYRQLSQELVREDSFASLTELKRCAEKHGLACALGKTGREGLSTLSMPVVVHFDVVSVRGQSGGHFAVVLHTEGDEVWYVDGTLGEIASMSWGNFERVWSGYVLYVKRRPDPLMWLWTGGALVGGVLLGLAVERGVRRGIWRGRGVCHTET